MGAPHVDWRGPDHCVRTVSWLGLIDADYNIYCLYRHRDASGMYVIPLRSKVNETW